MNGLLFLSCGENALHGVVAVGFCSDVGRKRVQRHVLRTLLLGRLLVLHRSVKVVNAVSRGKHGG